MVSRVVTGGQSIRVWPIEGHTDDRSRVHLVHRASFARTIVSCAVLESGYDGSKYTEPPRSHRSLLQKLLYTAVKAAAYNPGTRW